MPNITTLQRKLDKLEKANSLDGPDLTIIDVSDKNPTRHLYGKDAQKYRKANPDGFYIKVGRYEQ